MVQMLTITDTAHRAAGAVSSAAGTLWGGAKSAGSTVWNAVSTIFSDYIAPAANWAGRKILAGGRVSLAAAKAHPYITLAFVAGAGLAIAYKKGYLTFEKGNSSKHPAPTDNNTPSEPSTKVNLTPHESAIRGLLNVKVIVDSDPVPVISQENAEKIEQLLKAKDTSLDLIKTEVLEVMQNSLLNTSKAKAEALNKIADSWDLPKEEVIATFEDGKGF